MSIKRMWNKLWAPHPPLFKDIFFTYCAYVIFVVATVPFFHALAGRPSLVPTKNLPLFMASAFILIYRNRTHRKQYMAAFEFLGILRRVNRYGIFLNCFFSILSIGITTLLTS